MTILHHPAGPSFRWRSALLLFACCGLLQSMLAQQVVKAEFLSGPERKATAGPHQQLRSTADCTFVLDLAVTRAGQVSGVTVNRPLGTCSDTAFLAKAAQQARAYVFSAAPDAPEPQPVRITFRVGDPAMDAPDPDGGPAMPEPVAEENDRIWTTVEAPPQFPGGEGAMSRYIRIMMHYPDDALKAGKEGIAYVTFVVDKEGRLGDFIVAKGIDPSLEQEALRIVKSMPKWQPGRHNGDPVRVRCQVSIPFRIPSPETKVSGSGAGSGVGHGDGRAAHAPVSYELAGRTVRSAATITDKPTAPGRVVLDIWVDREGKVLRTEQNRKSTTLDTQLVAMARKAALATLFSKAPDGPEEQKGSITFEFDPE